jgi:lactate permease
MWNQVYNPLGSAALSTIAAAVPVVTLLVLIASNKVKAHIAAVIALIAANLVAIFIFTMPADMSLRATALGAVTGFFPIGWIVLNVIFMYRLTVETGRFETLQQAIGGVTPDRRLQLLLIAFSFGAFFEGASGFGTPVAVTGAILIGLGFSPLAASGLSLIANTAPVAYGALGTPIAGLASVTGLDPYVLGAMVGRQLPFFSLIVPFWLIWAFAGFRGMIQVWPAILVCAVSFAIPQFVISNYINPWIVDVGASLVSMACLIGFLKVWRPKELWLSPALRTRDDSAATAPPRPAAATAQPTSAEVWRAITPWIIVCAVLLIWGTGWFKAAVNPWATWNYPVPDLHNMINKVPPVAARPTPEGAVFAFTWLSFTGTGMLIAAIISGFVMGFTPGRMIAEYGRTIRICAYSLITISAMLAIGTLTRLSGLDATLGLAFAGTGGPVSVLRHAPRLARRRAHGLRYGLERALRQPPEDHLRAARPLARPDERREFFGRRHGQDDRRPVDRRRLDRHELVRPRGLDPALRVLALDRPRLPRRHPRDAPGLRASVLGDGAEVKPPTATKKGRRGAPLSFAAVRFSPPAWRSRPPWPRARRRRGSRRR